MKPPFLLLPILVLLAGCAAYGPPRIAGEQVHRNLVFASPGGRALRLDLYVPPKSARPAPVVLWIFGGSWKFGHRGYHVNVRDLTRFGIAVAAIDYRLSDEAIYPAQLADCRAAADWLRMHGARYGIDPARMGAAGESAGGQLAALLGLTEGRRQIRAVCALYAPTDLVALGRQYANADPSDIERLLGGPIEERLTLAREASPIDRIRADNAPSFLLIHGANDTLVSPAHSRRFDRRLREAGIESTLVVVPGRDHWFALDPALEAKVARFFGRYLANPPEPDKPPD